MNIGPNRKSTAWKGKAKREPHPISEEMRETAWDELVRLLIRGATIKQAADKMGFHRSTIQKWLRQEAFQVKLMRTRHLVFERTRDVVEEAVEEAEADLQKKMQQYARVAVEKMFNLMMTAEAEAVQLKAAEGLADRNAGTQKTRKLETGGSVMVVTPQLMAVAMAAAEELRIDHKLGRHIEAIPLEEGMAVLAEDEAEGPMEVEVELEEERRG